MQTLKAKVRHCDSDGKVYVTTENGLILVFYDCVPGTLIEDDEIILELKPGLGVPPKGGFKRSWDYVIREVVHVLR